MVLISYGPLVRKYATISLESSPCYYVSHHYFWGSVSFAVNTRAPVQAKITRAICGNQVERAVNVLPTSSITDALGQFREYDVRRNLGRSAGRARRQSRRNYLRRPRIDKHHV